MFAIPESMLGRKLDRGVASSALLYRSCERPILPCQSGNAYGLFVSCDRALPMATAWYSATCETWGSKEKAVKRRVLLCFLL